MKITKILSLVVLLLTMQVVVFNTIVEAKEASYKSNSGVGFYGEYEFPDDKKPSITYPEKDGGHTIAPGKIGGGSNGGNMSLPQTGEKKSDLSLVGSSIIGLYYLIKRKQKSIEKGSYNK